jgi:hypothetical protein
MLPRAFFVARNLLTYPRIRAILVVEPETHRPLRRLTLMLATAPAPLSSRYPGTCDCGSSFPAGTPIVRLPSGRYGHADCLDAWAAGAWDGRKVPGFAKVKAATGGPDLSALPVGDSFHAVTNSSGALTFFRVSNLPAGTWHDGSPRAAGWVFVHQYLGGQGVAQRVGKQRPGGTYDGQWPAMVAAIAADPKASAMAFATNLGRCYSCGSELTDDLSRKRGQGPTCYAKAS